MGFKEVAVGFGMGALTVRTCTDASELIMRK